jgi:hypothetical protein
VGWCQVGRSTAAAALCRWGKDAAAAALAEKNIIGKEEERERVCYEKGSSDDDREREREIERERERG